MDKSFRWETLLLRSSRSEHHDCSHCWWASGRERQSQEIKPTELEMHDQDLHELIDWREIIAHGNFGFISVLTDSLGTIETRAKICKCLSSFSHSQSDYSIDQRATSTIPRSHDVQKVERWRSDNAITPSCCVTCSGMPDKA